MGAVIEVKYFNTFLLRKTNEEVDNSFAYTQTPSWNGSTGIPSTVLGGYPIIDSADISVTGNNWVIEESRIRGGYNNTTVDLGVRAYLVEEESNGFRRQNSLIYSGIFNSRTGINNTNVFSVAEEITKSADPANGSIQKLYAEDSNLIIFQESKVSRALIDKDAIYSAEGGGSITNVNTTIGTIQPYSGNFGISRDPGSFAAYGYRKYFTDRDRNAVLRLSMDGITDISNYGMNDYFRDRFSDINTSGLNGVVISGWDIYNKQYVISTMANPRSSDKSYDTLSFDEDVNGFPSFYTYKPDQLFSVRGSFYSLKNGKIWKHYSENVNRGSFYGDNSYETNRSYVEFVFNPNVSASKVFKTISYEGSNGWKIESFITDIGDNSDVVFSYDEGYYIENNIGYRAGFEKKESKYHANLVNNTSAKAGEVLWGNNMTGVKGYFSTVTISTDNNTKPGKLKELFAVSSNYVESSY